MEQQKKKRGENWSSEEKEILRQLLAESAHILENKSTKTSINLLKTKEWKNLGIKFNEITGKERSQGELKLAWKRMKLSAKSKLSAHRRAQTQTGGGDKPPSPSPEDIQIMAIAPHDFVIEVNNYDSDAVIPVTMPSTSTIFTDPEPGPSFINQCEVILKENQDHHVVEVQEISKNSTTDAENTRITINDFVNTRSTKKKKFKNSSEEMRQTIISSNTDFKRRQLEMMEVEHNYNIKIANLKIKKLELEIALLENKKHQC